ncbi:MAG TPA: phosphatidate cytidylyltransferase, partial [Candidatus Babeliaceae bacterium]|nr:phosphatidate cytidylyltransferase [Candidatus Babeliaceae bacterium]
MLIYNNFIARLITAVTLTVTFSGIYSFFPPIVLSLVFIALLVFILRFEWPFVKIPFLTPLYPIAPFVILIMLNHSIPRAMLAFLSVTVFSHDTGSYIIGKLFGNHLLCSSISPGKTVEGFIGGCIVSCIAA